MVRRSPSEAGDRIRSRRAPRIGAVVRSLLVGAALLLRSAPATGQAPRPLERLFYYVDREDSYGSLVRNIDEISILAPQVYVVDSLGIVWGSLDSRVIALAKGHGVRLMPLVKNEDFNQHALRRLLADTAARARAVATLVELCRRNGYWGIQFDIENVNLQDRDLLTAWYRETASALHAAGFAISIAVVHRIDDMAGETPYHRFLYESWRAGYDLKALGQAGDFISLMSYSEHTRRTPPGPGAGLDWVRANVDYFLRFVPKEKLSVGIPLLSFHWYTREDRSIPERARSWNESVSWNWGAGIAARHGAAMQWDSTAASPYAYFSNGGVYEWLFLENARSFRAKFDLAKARSLRGFSAWVLGPEDPAIWDILRAEHKR